MSRLRRFEQHRYVGLRDSMTVFDTDDVAQAAALSALFAEHEPVQRLAVSTFGPDNLAEARYRGFRPAS